MDSLSYSEVRAYKSGRNQGIYYVEATLPKEHWKIIDFWIDFWWILAFGFILGAKMAPTSSGASERHQQMYQQKSRG